MASVQEEENGEKLDDVTNDVRNDWKKKQKL